MPSRLAWRERTGRRVRVCHQDLPSRSHISRSASAHRRIIALDLEIEAQRDRDRLGRGALAAQLCAVDRVHIRGQRNAPGRALQSCSQRCDGKLSHSSSWNETGFFQRNDARPILGIRGPAGPSQPITRPQANRCAILPARAAPEGAEIPARSFRPTWPGYWVPCVHGRLLGRHASWSSSGTSRACTPCARSPTCALAPAHAGPGSR